MLRLSFGILFIGLFSCRTSDPLLQERALRNENHIGFVSREFFQSVVAVDIPRRDWTILEERAFCKKASYSIRDSQSLEVLQRERILFLAQDHPQGGFFSQLRFYVLGPKPRKNPTNSQNPGNSPVANLPNPSTSAPGTNLPSTTGSATTGPATSNLDPGYVPKPTAWESTLLNKTGSEEEINRKKIEKANSFPLLSQSHLSYRGDFLWFLDSMFLYKEDYTTAGKCKFIYRNIQKGLYQRVVETRMSFDPEKDELLSE